MCNNGKDKACQEAQERYDAYLDKVSQTSKMSKSAFVLAKDYAKAMEYNQEHMNARTFLNFLSDVEFSYTTGVMTSSIVRGSMQKYFNVGADEWGMTTRETNLKMLDCLDWEKEELVYINDQEWLEYEDVVKDLWYNEGYRTDTLFKEYVKNAFMWNGVSPKDFNKLSKADISIYDDSVLKVKNSMEVNNEFLIKAFEQVVETDEIFRKIFLSQFKIREGRTKKFFETRLNKENHIMFSSPLNIFYSGEMYRHAKFGKMYQFDNELLVAYYLRVEKIKYPDLEN